MSTSTQRWEPRPDWRRGHGDEWWEAPATLLATMDPTDRDAVWSALGEHLRREDDWLLSGGAALRRHPDGLLLDSAGQDAIDSLDALAELVGDVADRLIVAISGWRPGLA